MKLYWLVAISSISFCLADEFVISMKKYKELLKKNLPYNLMHPSKNIFRRMKRSEFDRSYLSDIQDLTKFLEENKN